MTYALGIDIGTTYTAAAIWRNGRADTVPLADRAHSIPSVLFQREDGEMLVGDAANRRGATDPTRLARDFKDRLGSPAPLLLGDTEVGAEDLTGYLLRWVVDRVVEREGERPAHTVLTCPATWGDYRRELMTEVAATARLTDVGLLAEPVAAAVYYASRERLAPDTIVGVYDLGGGTFDATVLRKTAGGFEILGSPGGDDSIGGTDFDEVVMAHIANTIGVRWHSYDADDPAVRASLARVRDYAVEAKEALSSDVDATIPVMLPDLTRDIRITRGEFEGAIRIPILRTVDTFRQTLEGANVDPADLHAVLLVGGSSRIPLVSQLIASELGVPVSVDAHPKYAVCLGAAVSAGSRLRKAEPARSSTASPMVAAAPPFAPPAFTPPAFTPPAFAPPAFTPPAFTPPPVTAPTVATPTIGTPPATAPPEPPTWAQPPPRTIEYPVADALEPATASDAGAELLVFQPTSVAVDLAGAGITDPMDALLFPPPQPARAVPRLTAVDGPLRIEHTGDVRRGRRLAILVGALTLALVVTATVLGILSRQDTTPSPTATSGLGSAATWGLGDINQGGRHSAVLQAATVPSVAGDVLHAITPAPGGFIAVGGSVTVGVPRTWRYAAGAWSTLAGPTTRKNQQGDMNGVAAGPKGTVLAVGWLASPSSTETAQAPPSARRPAIWRSAGGRPFRLVPVKLRAGIAELTDIAALPGGGFLAAGVDWSADPDSGDGVILTSPDGTRWAPVAAQGLDGPGTATLRRLLPTRGGGALAIGTRLNGAVSQSVVWTSPDTRTWTVAGALPDTDTTASSAWGLTRRADGSLLVAGFRTRPDGISVPVLWDGTAPDALHVRDVTGTGSVYAAVASGTGVLAVGTQQSDADARAAAWTVKLP